MKSFPAIIILMGQCALAGQAIAEQTIREHDVVIFRGYVQHCEDLGQFVNWRNRVVDGKLEIYGQSLEVVGLTPKSLYESLSKLFGPGLGTRLSSVTLEVMSSDEYEDNRIDLCKEGRLMLKAMEACEKRIREYRERQEKIAAAAPGWSFKRPPGTSRPGTPTCECRP
jgi:hypothetical protein